MSVYRYAFVFVCLVCVYLVRFLWFACLSVCRSVCLICLSGFCLSGLCLSVCLSVSVCHIFSNHTLLLNHKVYESTTNK